MVLNGGDKNTVNARERWFYGENDCASAKKNEHQHGLKKLSNKINAVKIDFLCCDAIINVDRRSWKAL